MGIELASIGRFEPNSPEDLVIVHKNETEHRYRKLVISNRKIAGAILLGHQQDVPVVTAAIKKGQNVSPYLDALRSGNWQILGQQPLG